MDHQHSKGVKVSDGSPADKCSVCEEWIAEWRCGSCDRDLCQECDLTIHSLEGKGKHQRERVAQPLSVKPEEEVVDPRLLAEAKLKKENEDAEKEARFKKWEQQQKLAAAGQKKEKPGHMVYVRRPVLKKVVTEEGVETFVAVEGEFVEVEEWVEDEEEGGDHGGEVVLERDMEQLYFLYLTSSPEHWQYIMDSNGLTSHLHEFQASESQSGEYYSALNLPDLNLKGTLTGLALDIMTPEVDALSGLDSQVALPEFYAAIHKCVPVWIAHTRYRPLARQETPESSAIAMIAALILSLKHTPIAKGFLDSCLEASVSDQVVAAIEKGQPPPSAARTVPIPGGMRDTRRVDATKLPYRILDVYNGPNFAARIEERAGHFLARNTTGPFTQRGAFQLPCEGYPSSYSSGYLSDPFSSEEVLMAVQRATSFATLLATLLDAGFDLSAPAEKDGANAGRCWRIKQGKFVAGALWDCPGQLSCLRFQTRKGFFAQEWGMLCVYRDPDSDVYSQAWTLFQSCATSDEMRRGLVHLGYTLHQVHYKSHIVRA